MNRSNLTLAKLRELLTVTPLKVVFKYQGNVVAALDWQELPGRVVLIYSTGRTEAVALTEEIELWGNGQ